MSNIFEGLTEIQIGRLFRTADKMREKNGYKKPATKPKGQKKPKTQPQKETQYSFNQLEQRLLELDKQTKYTPTERTRAPGFKKLNCSTCGVLFRMANSLMNTVDGKPRQPLCGRCERK